MNWKETEDKLQKIHDTIMEVVDELKPIKQRIDIELKEIGNSPYELSGAAKDAVVEKCERLERLDEIVSEVKTFLEDKSGDLFYAVQNTIDESPAPPNEDAE